MVDKRWRQTTLAWKEEREETKRAKIERKRVFI